MTKIPMKLGFVLGKPFQPCLISACKARSRSLKGASLG